MNCDSCKRTVAEFSRCAKAGQMCPHWYSVIGKLPDKKVDERAQRIAKARTGTCRDCGKSICPTAKRCWTCHAKHVARTRKAAPKSTQHLELIPT